MHRRDDTNGRHDDDGPPDGVESGRPDEALKPPITAQVLTTAFAGFPTAAAIMRLDDFVILEVNRAWQELFGYSRQEVIGVSAANLHLWAPQKTSCLQRIQSIFRNFEQTALRKSGKPLLTSSYVERMRISEEDLLLMTWHDITQQKRAEEEWREDRHMLSESQHLAHVGSWSLSIGTEIIQWSEETYRIYGMDPDTFVPNIDHLISLIHPNDRPLMQEWIRACMAGERPDELEFRAVHPDGTVRILCGRGSMEYDAHGTPVRIMGTVQDITDRKNIEDALRETNAQLELRVQERTAELDQRASHLRALAGELTISEQRERERLARILHDNLQQLLVGARFRLAELEKIKDPIVQSARERVDKLLDESIQISRSLTAELSPPVLHQSGLTAGLEWLARWIGNKHNLIVHLSDGEPLPSLPEAVEMLLFESVRELLFNAVKHAHTKTAHVSAVITDTGFLQITVRDEGVGFDPSVLKKIGQSGSGFGLFSIRERLSLIGGKMEIDSAPGRGSRFTLTAPLADAISVRPAEKRGLLRPAARKTLSTLGGPIRVLLADDHAVMREGLARLLLQEPDMEIIKESAANGQEAIDMSGRSHPDVILMDISMPVVNGIEATRIIRDRYPNICIIGLSMFEEEERAKAMLEAGAERYLTKTAPVADLVAAIRACMVG